MFMDGKKVWAANRAKSAFLGKINLELRDPPTGIIDFPDLIAGKVFDPLSDT